MLNLPTELALAVLAYLPIDSLRCLSLVCWQWNKFINLQENAIYHQAAVLHKLIPRSMTSLEEAQNPYSNISLAGVGGWKDLCKSSQLVITRPTFISQQARDAFLLNGAGKERPLRI
jgi:hypothetical protein